jgi:hypothetical protein
MATAVSVRRSLVRASGREQAHGRQAAGSRYTGVLGRRAPLASLETALLHVLFDGSVAPADMDVPLPFWLTVDSWQWRATEPAALHRSLA